jgi:hypothetical protein
MEAAGIWRRILGGIAVMAVASAGWAQESRPTTAPALVEPASRPSSMPSDQSTPKAALKKLSHAMDAGDQAAIRQVLDYEGKLQGEMADSIGQMAAAQAQLKHAALQTYGKEGARGLLGDSISEVGDQLLESAQEHITGDSATVSIPGGDSIVLKRIDGQWKLPLSEVSKGISEQEIRQRIDEIAHQAAIYRETAEEVTNKKYKTSEQVAEALRGRLLKAATQPTSRPVEGEPATLP